MGEDESTEEQPTDAQPPPTESVDPVETPAQVQERLARDQLQQARLAFERGAFDRAVRLFEAILGTPVALRTVDDLHEGFLHYAFTLCLMGDVVSAARALETALRLKPAFAPSPVTTRPDLLSFYDEQREHFLRAGGIQRLPQEIFPELADRGRFVKTRKEVPFPLLGIRLRQLGYHPLGDTLLALEASGAALNAAGWILWLSVRPDLTPKGDVARDVFIASNPFTFSLFWGAVAAELIVTAVLNEQARALRTGDDEPDAGPRATEATDRLRRRRAPPRLELAPDGLRLRVW